MKPISTDTPRGRFAKAGKRPSTRAARGAIALALGAGSIFTAVPLQAAIGPGDPPSRFSYLRSTDEGASFDPAQLAQTPEAGITGVGAYDGTVHAIYDSQDPQPRELYYRRSTNSGRSFGPSTRLDRPQANTTEVGDSGEADLAVTPARVDVVWEEDAFLTSDLVLAAPVRIHSDLLLSNGTVIDSETPPGEDDDDDTNNTVIPAGTVFPAGSMDPCCDATFFVGTSSTTRVVNRDDAFYTRSTDDGQSFALGRNITNSPDVHNRDPVVASDGSLVAVAYEARDSVPGAPNLTVADDVLFARSTDGGSTWTDVNINLTNAAGNQDEPAIGASGSDVHVVYRDRTPTRISYVRSTSSGAPGSFSAPIQLPVPAPAGDYTSDATPGILVQGNVVHVLACHEDGPSPTDGNDLIYWRSSDGGATWSDARVIDRSTEPCNKPVLDGAGSRLRAVYERDVFGQSDVVLLPSADAGLTWGTPRNLSNDHESSADPTIAFDPADPGDLHISWSDKTNFLFSIEDREGLPLEDGTDRRFENEDVIRFTGAAYEMVFDGSDVGLGSAAIDALATIPPASPGGLPSLVLSFTSSRKIGTLGTVDDSDLVLFTPTSLGETTAGTFSLYFDGSDIGLTSSDEDVDAVDIDQGTIYLSTTSDFKLTNGLKGKDEDIFACTATVTGPVSSCGSTALAVDGSTIGLESTGEDVDAFSFTGEGNVEGGAALFSTTSNYTLPTTSGTDGDLFSCTFPDDTGSLTDCGTPASPLNTVWNGIRHADMDEDVTALELEF